MRTSATSHVHAELRLLFMRPRQEGPAPLPQPSSPCTRRTRKVREPQPGGRKRAISYPQSYESERPDAMTTLHRIEGSSNGVCGHYGTQLRSRRDSFLK